VRTEPNARAPWRTPWLWGYLVLYAVVLLLMNRREGFGPGLPLLALLVMGGAFSALAWALTRRLSPLPRAVSHPPREAALVFACVAVVIAFITWGLDGLHALFPAEPAGTLAVTGAKLVVFVLLPALALHAVSGQGPRELFPVGAPRGHIRAALLMSGAMLAFQMVAGRGLSDLQRARLPAWALVAGAAGGLLWSSLEAGLVEEFFFRTFVQSRLAALLRSELAGAVLMCLLFGLAHAPGYYLRTSRTLEGLGPHPSLLTSLGFAVVVTSTVGFPFAVLWARTRNLLVVVLVHGAADWLQSIVPFVAAWGIGRP